MSDKSIFDKFRSARSARFDAGHAFLRQAAPRRSLRAPLSAIAATAITLSAVTDGYAQRIVTTGRVNVPTTSVRAPVVDVPRVSGSDVPRISGSDVPRFSGSDVPRYPAGFSPRVPGGAGGVIVIPSGRYFPGGRGPAVVYEDDDQAIARHHVKRTEKKQKKTQIASRSGFNPPPLGERRFVRNELLLNLQAGTSAPALDVIARRHRLTRLDLQSFAMTRRSLARVRINDGRPVATVIRSLQADTRILGAQPNYLYALQQGAASPAAAGPEQYSLAKMHLPEAHAITT